MNRFRGLFFLLLCILTNTAFTQSTAKTLAQEYQLNKTDYAKLPDLYFRASGVQDWALADTIAVDCMHNYLDKLSLDEFAEFMTRNPSFCRGPLFYLMTSRDPIFQWYYKHGNKLDSAMPADFPKSHSMVNAVIFREEIAPKVEAAEQSGKEPDWEQISQTIQNKYGKDYITDNDYMVSSKRDWSSKHKN